MRWKTQALVAGVLALAWAAPAYACDFWFNPTFLDSPANPSIGVGLQTIRHFTTVSVDAAFRAGDQVVIRPALGSCHYSAPGFSESNVVYGATIGVRLWSDPAGKTAINGQFGGEFDSFEGGSESNIPIGGAIRYKASDVVDLFGGAAVNVYHESFDDGSSYSHNDLSIFAGASFKSGNVRIFGGVANFQYENTSETALNLGVSFELGGMSHGLRAIGSQRRRR